jgi:phosphate-selective porin OprO and OprP
MRKFLFCFFMFLSGTSITPMAYADNNQALMELLKALEDNGTITKDVYELVLAVAQQGETEQPVVAATKDIKKMIQAEVKVATKDQPRITMKDKFEVKSGDGDFSLRVGGRIQADAATYLEDNRKHNDGTEMRRARLFVQGTLWEAWKYKLQYDFVNTGSSGIADAYIQYAGVKDWKFTVGHFKQAFSLQNMTSSKYITFTERGLPHLFTPGRGIGVGVGRSSNNWSINAGLFGEGIDGASGDADEGYAITGRATYAPILDKQQHLHLGVSASYRNSGSIDAIRFRDRPESHVTNTREVDTGSLNADSNLLAVGEAAYTYGSLSLQSEYYYIDIDRDGAGPDLDFSGYYVEGSWFLTNDMRRYSGSKGSYGKVKPRSIVGKGGMGAWQLAVRFSSIDLNDNDIAGGDAQNLSLGLNWYATNNIRMSANYVNVLDVVGGTGDADEPEAFQMRAQVEF